MAGRRVSGGVKSRGGESRDPSPPCPSCGGPSSYGCLGVVTCDQCVVDANRRRAEAVHRPDECQVPFCPVCSPPESHSADEELVIVASGVVARMRLRRPGRVLAPWKLLHRASTRLVQ